MTSVALFAGPGGTCLGAHALGIKPLGIEWDDAACQTRRAAGLPTLQGDVAAIDPPDHAPIAGLIATPACQAFSMAGKGLGRDHVPAIVECLTDLMAGRDTRAEHNATCDDPRAMLVVEPLRWALALRPRWIMLEQVPPVLELWRVMADHLRELGYSAWAGVLSAEQYGVPQTRKRAFLIASLDRTVQPPEPTHQRYVPGEPATGTEPSLLGPGLLPWVSMAQALGMSEGPSPSPSPSVTGGGGETGGVEVFASKAARARASRAVLPTHYDRRQQQGPRREDGTRDPVRLVPVDEPAPTLGAQGLATGRDVWVHDRPATTISGDPRGCPEPGYRKGNERQWNENAVRVSVQEAARLQTFPANYPWQGSRTAVYRQIGDAVPVALALAVIGAATGTDWASAHRAWLDRLDTDGVREAA